MSQMAVIGLRWCIGLLLCAGVVPLGWAQPGGKIWEFKTRKEITSTALIAGDGSILVGGNDGFLYSLNSNGTLRWELALGSAIVATPSLGADGLAYVGTVAGMVFAVTPAGKIQWQYNATSSIEASLALGVDDTLFVACMDGRLLALTTQGQLRWSYTAKGAIHSSPIVGPDSSVYLADRAGWLHAVSQAGLPLWQFNIGAPVEGSPIIGEDGVILLGALDRRVYAFRSDGTKLWSYDTGHSIYGAPAAAVDGTIYVGTEGGRLCALSTLGTNLWRYVLDSPVGSSAPAVASDGTICLGSSAGILTAVRADGVKRWSFTATNGFNYSSPTIAADGTVYIGSQDGMLYAIRGTAGPQVGGWTSFRRDVRGTASGFVRRYVPVGYSPGAELTVRLAAVPPPRVTQYSVEDYVPQGWVVTDPSDGGSYDSISRRVIFGPFLDAIPRNLTYSVTPPSTDTGSKTITGSSIANNEERGVYGINVLKYYPLNPADSRPADGWITLNELTSYGAAWRKGSTWPLGVVPIPSSYVNKAVELWRAGELHRYDTNYPSAPEWWVSDRNPLAPAPDLPAKGIQATNGYARSVFLPALQPSSSNVTVVILVTPMTNAVVYAVEDRPPVGWSVSNISNGGTYDSSTGKVKWGPFFDHDPRDLSYEVLPQGASGDFLGWVSIDSSMGEILGQRSLNLGDPVGPWGRAVRTLPDTFSPGAAALVTLSVRLTNASVYSVEENVPVGWQATNVSSGGYYDASSRTVRFGLFQDGQSRDFSYSLLPPFGETNTVRISGTLNLDGVLFACVGDAFMTPSPLHPADLSVPDHWLSATELTLYALAWKKGSLWPVPPSLIPPDYLNQAALLWRGGELYRVDTNFASAPSWWVVDGSQPGQTNPVPPVFAAVTNGSITCQMPTWAEAGVDLQVSLRAVPNTNVQTYVVEDRPPTGWQIVRVDGGFLDSQRGKAKWGPFFDNVPRTLTYMVRPAAPTSQIVRLEGGASYDGVYSRTLGDRDVFVQVDSGGPVFAERSLPDGYAPGGKVVVQVQVAGDTATAYYIVEEQVPAGWTTGAISDYGTFDPLTRRVKFGPYFDGVVRTLSYEILPPLTETNTVQLLGFTLVDGVEGLVGGDRTLVLLQLHPGDNAPVDGWLTVSEMTSYVAAWRRGATWPIAPSPIPAEYATRAIGLWLGGERYALDPGKTNAPDWWVNATNQPLPDVLPMIPVGATATNGTAKCELEKVYQTLTPFVVTLQVTPSTNVQVYAFEDQPPAGWQVTEITGGGVWDAYVEKVKWGPFFDRQTRTVTYTVIPVANSVIGVFQGGAAFDFDNADFTGDRRTYSSAHPPSGLIFPGSVLSPQGFLLPLAGATGEAYRIDLSSNLVDWSTLVMITNFPGTGLYGTNLVIDPQATNQPMRFYRSTWLP